MGKIDWEKSRANKLNMYENQTTPKNCVCGKVAEIKVQRNTKGWEHKEYFCCDCWYHENSKKERKKIINLQYI